MKKFDNFKILLNCKELKTKSINYDESDQVFHISAKLNKQDHYINLLKNKGIELIYGLEYSKPISYTLPDKNSYTYDEIKEFESFIANISKTEWDKS